MTDILRKNRMKADKYHRDFKRVFGVGLMNYFNFIFGFDIVLFDEQVVKPPEGKSTKEAIREKHGDEGVQIIEGLIA